MREPKEVRIMRSRKLQRQPMRKISPRENASMDAEADAEFAAGVGIPLNEVFD
jgi:hypothetical protein